MVITVLHLLVYLARVVRVSHLFTLNVLPNPFLAA